ncbi:MAG: ImmA/IrrE family metallo-endopeptidase [Candidatus Latescibacteria bacterium]|nr:ImmA/IrrE family metallo-endopeptidase [Candidatus Latescibacterota bacterium]
MTSRRLQITLQPEVLRWARERAGFERPELARKLQVSPERVSEWERNGKISVAQADRLAQRTHTALGFLYLAEPPEERLPIPDFRTRDNAPPYLMQRRQAWMRDELIEGDAEPLDFVGAYGTDAHPRQVGAAMRDALQLTEDWAEKLSAWSDALRHLRHLVDAAGVLVSFSGVVGNNVYRKLDPDEFQGFALVDEYAPLVFVNSADFMAAQMFTLAHELAHLFIAQSGISNLEALQPPSDETEQFCNKAAAEFLIPEEELRAFWPSARRTNDPYQAIAHRFKVSSIVAVRRALDLDSIGRDEFFRFYNHQRVDRWRSDQQRQGSGGHFWNTQKWRIGPRFASAIVRAVGEGRLPYREAYNLTGLPESKGDRFNGDYTL